MARKLPILLTFLLVIGSIVLLSTSVPQLNLSQQGQRFRLPTTQTDEIEQRTETTSDSEPLSMVFFSSSIWERFISAMFVLLFAAALLTKEGRERFFRAVLMVLPLMMVMYSVTFAWPIIETIIAEFQSLLRANEDAPVLQFVGGVPPYIIVLVSVALALATVLAGWGVTVYLQRRRVFSTVSAEATTALAKLNTGAELRHTIIECYRAMGNAVGASRGIRRANSATPREYEARLVTAGLPHDAVQRLTRLFEQVRYGGQHAGDAGRLEAQTCLQAIIDACEAKR